MIKSIPEMITAVLTGVQDRPWSLVGTQTASPARLTEQALAVFGEPGVRAELVEDIATWLELLDQAWDAPSDKTTAEWQRERARTAVTVLLSHLGHGTPLMRGEHCGVELPDGSRCGYGRHHKIRKHRSGTGQELVVM